MASISYRATVTSNRYTKFYVKGILDLEWNRVHGGKNDKEDKQKFLEQVFDIALFPVIHKCKA